MENIPQQPNQWIQGEAESQSAIMLSQHSTYMLKYKLIINKDGSQVMQNQEVLDFIEPYNPDYPLGYLRGGQKTLAAMTKAQALSYATASKILANLNDEQTTNIQQAQGNHKYNLIAEYLSQDSASNLKFCVDYFNDFSIRKQSLVAGSRTTGTNTQLMRQFRNPIEPASGYEEKNDKKGWFR